MTAPGVSSQPVQPKKRGGCMKGCLIAMLVVMFLAIGCGATFLLGRHYVVRHMETAIPPNDLSHYWKAVNVYDQIHLAYLEGEIDRRTEVLLLLQAAYSPESLPGEFDGPRPDKRRDLQAELQWLLNHYDQLDPGTQQMVRPFVLSPQDPESFFHHAYDKEISILSGLSPVKTAYASSADPWNGKSIVIEGAPEITLYYAPGGGEGEGAQLRAIEEALRKAWPMFRDLLNIQPRKEIEVYFTDRIDDFGLARYSDTSYTIKLRSNLAGAQLKGTTVHELFHLFQFEMGLTWFDVDADLDWLTEATAVWAEHYVYPGNHTEHYYLFEFFDYLDQERVSLLDLKAYESYMLFFFLSDSRNKVSYIPDILWAVESQRDVRSVLMTEISDLGNKYGEFALCSWNYDPPHRCAAYIGDDIPPYPPGGSSRQSFTVEAPGKRRYPDLLQPGGIIYRVFSITAPPDEIRKVTFYLQPTDPDQGFPDCLCEASPVWDWVGDPVESEWLRKQALIKIGDSWLPEPEDWTGLDHREFDRTRDGERVTKVILIISNADMRDSLNHEFVVAAEGKPALVPLAAIGPAKGYRFPGSESWMHAHPPAQDFRWNIPGEEVVVPMSEHSSRPWTTTLYLPGADPPLVVHMPRCWWPVIGEGFSKVSGNASRGLTAPNNQRVEAGGSYLVSMTVRCPGDYSNSELYNQAAQYAQSYIPPALYNLMKKHLVDNVLDDGAVHFRWRLHTAAAAPVPEDRHLMDATEVHTYGFTPAGDEMVLQVMRGPDEPESEVDIEISWSYEGRGHSSSGNYGMVAVEGSYEVFDSCQGAPIMTGELFAESSTSAIAESGSFILTLPENTRYLQVAVHAEAESFATRLFEVVVEA